MRENDAEGGLDAQEGYQTSAALCLGGSGGRARRCISGGIGRQTGTLGPVITDGLRRDRVLCHGLNTPRKHLAIFFCGVVSFSQYKEEH